MARLPGRRALLAAVLGVSWQQRLLGHHVVPAAWRRRCLSAGSRAEDSSQVTPMLKHLMFKIKSTGPITVAEYMREVLTNPVKGYYMHHDMLGERGDFVTSPEISQIFGELIGIWYVSEWMATGKPKTFQLVELGPEVSPKLSEIQALTLTGGKIQPELDVTSPVYMKGISKAGIPIFWYRELQDVPQGTSFYLAHEFFDALPIHKFQRTEKGWREVLIDIDPEAPDQLRFVLAPSTTPATEHFIQRKEVRDHVEVCPDAGILIQRLACRIQEDGGAALIADYGHNGNKTDTFRSFRSHELHDALIAPGTADLTADVDFSYLRTMTQGRVATLGPLNQHEFLKNMGIDVRLQVLLQNSSDKAMHKHLLQGYDMLMNPKKMGDRFHFFALLPHQRLAHSDQKVNLRHSRSLSATVAGFGELVWK
ncbi:protein arginine methyltransferase NDUFAF7, mitochondrial isoform X2 [Gopherus flavomarginatus]|uniref:protein arginine methyltransferase NDUFAF7, mitochondrial isoform X2 n=1 Tax=Gopherus flavomarginatus TaxID=286002 RepID=UPI0021CBFA7C|nr:protein arginine methyltransferase NDUFAF7, mitochondrial isoform X2 [Gopherus flavomarginatus]